MGPFVGKLLSSTLLYFVSQFYPVCNFVKFISESVKEFIVIIFLILKLTIKTVPLKKSLLFSLKVYN